jgi:hypothetical protein
MTGPATLVDAYCRAWSDPDPAQRKKLLNTALAPDATYTDPRADCRNPGELLAHIAKILADRPGARIELTSRVDMHHNVARFHWQVVMPDGTKLPEGIDFVEFTPDRSRIRSIVGFFGPLAR